MGKRQKTGLVKLYNGPEPTTCKCGDWRTHFNNHSTQWVIWCTEITCERIAIKGSLVQHHKSRNTEIFVVPLCHFHAHSTKPLDIGDIDPINITQHKCK